MGRNAVTKSGNDRVYTPLPLCTAITHHYNPTGSILEPCSGSGNFVTAFKLASLSNITFFDLETNNTDFLTYTGSHDWLITNPPFSKLHSFIRHAMLLQIPNIVFLCYANTFMMNGKFKSLKEFGYSIVEMAFCTSPHYHEDFDLFSDEEQWPQSGFALAAVHIQRGDVKVPISPTLKVSYLSW